MTSKIDSVDLMSEYDQANALKNPGAVIPLSTPATITSERGKTHGKFSNTSDIIQRFKRVMYLAEARRVEAKQPALTPAEREAMEMILHKCGRILSGDASFADHWNNIAGYAFLPVHGE